MPFGLQGAYPGDEITVAGGRLQLACLFDELKALLAGG